MTPTHFQAKFAGIRSNLSSDKNHQTLCNKTQQSAKSHILKPLLPYFEVPTPYPPPQRPHTQPLLFSALRRLSGQGIITPSVLRHTSKEGGSLLWAWTLTWAPGIQAGARCWAESLLEGAWLQCSTVPQLHTVLHLMVRPHITAGTR